MDKNIYGFVFYLLFFALYESSVWNMLNYSFVKVRSDQVAYSGNQGNYFKTETKSRSCYVSIYGVSGEDLPLQFGDIVFNEVMADPFPVVKLPNAEFIELKNTSGSAMNLKNWVLEINGRAKILADQLIMADSFLILSGSGGDLQFAGYGQNFEIAGLSLPNDGFVLKLYSSLKTLIDSLSYTPGMLREGYSNGGYSLERIDPQRICGAVSNWKSSLDSRGGTPGSVNSVYAVNIDSQAPSIVSVKAQTPELLEVSLSEMPDRSLLAGSIFSFQPPFLTSDSVRFDPVYKKYSFYFPKGALSNGAFYELYIKDLVDECGNRMADEHRLFSFYLPKAGDLLINEVLFNPNSDGVDFVELFNQSGRNINLEDLFLAVLDDNLRIKTLYPLSETQKELSDSQYGAFTSDPENLLSGYNSTCQQCIFGMEKFPSYNQAEGWVVLVNKELNVIDQFHYLESMHNPLLTDFKGVSLERSSFAKPTQDRLNWHSASATTGFATPGYRNSAAEVPDKNRPKVHIEPKIFSPNDDGVNDRLVIKLSPGEPDRIANIRIFNESGIEIRRLANNLLLGSADIVEWDGTKNNHQKAPLGIYIVQVELFGLQGGSDHFKSACVLTDRLE